MTTSKIAPAATPIPMPAFAPVESPLPECWSFPLLVAVGVAIVLVVDVPEVPEVAGAVEDAVEAEGEVMVDAKSDDRQRIDIPLALIPKVPVWVIVDVPVPESVTV